MNGIGIPLRLGGALAALTAVLAMGGCAGDDASSLGLVAPTTWADTPPVADDGVTPLQPQVSARLEPGGAAYVDNFPQGKTIIRDYNGRRTQCVKRSSERRYSGPARWRSLDQADVAITFADSDVTVNARNGRFASIDWTEMLFAACDDMSSPWKLFVTCGQAAGYSAPPCPRNPSVAPSQRAVE